MNSRNSRPAFRGVRRDRLSLLLALAVGLALAPACGPKVRQPLKIKPKQQLEACGALDHPVTREQAICIARLAGINTTEGAYEISVGKELNAGPTWKVEEICDARNPKCIGIHIRQSDGTIANTRYLYAFEPLK